MTEELKPCPFCGGPATNRLTNPRMDNAQGVTPGYCRCEDRRCIGGKIQYAVADWNTRHITIDLVPPEVRREIEARALEKVGTIRMRGIDSYCSGWNDAMSRARKEAAKLRGGGG